MAGEQVKTLLQMLSLSRKPAILAVPMLEYCLVRPLPLQQEVVMISMKTLLLIKINMRFGAFTFVCDLTHHKRTSADDSQVVRSCVSILPSMPSRLSGSEVDDYYSNVATNAFGIISARKEMSSIWRIKGVKKGNTMNQKSKASD